MPVRGSLGLLLMLAGFSAAQDTNFPVGPQYLITSASPIFLQPIGTPSLSLSSSQLQPQEGEGAAEQNSADRETSQIGSSVLAGQRSRALMSIYYGSSQVSSVEIAFRESAGGGATVPMPAGIFEAGVVELTSPQALREDGYGIPLAEAAARWKTHKPSARHLYTNADVERQRPRN
jgi:hypothetical protein